MHLRRTCPLAALLALALVCGCQPSNDGSAPTRGNRADDLRLVAQGRNQELRFKADEAGTIYVNNFTAGDYLYTGPLAKGDTFVLTPNSNRAMVNKQSIYLDHDTNTHDEYRLYFLNRETPR